MSTEFLYTEIRRIAKKLEKEGFDEAVYLIKKLLKENDLKQKKLRNLILAVKDQNRMIEEQYKEIHALRELLRK